MSPFLLTLPTRPVLGPGRPQPSQAALATLYGGSYFWEQPAVYSASPPQDPLGTFILSAPAVLRRELSLFPVNLVEREEASPQS